MRVERFLFNIALGDAAMVQCQVQGQVQGAM